MSPESRRWRCSTTVPRASTATRAIPSGPTGPSTCCPTWGKPNLFDQARISDYKAGYDAEDLKLRDRWRDVVKDKEIPTFVCPADYAPRVPFEGYKAPLIPSVLPSVPLSKLPLTGILPSNLPVHELPILGDTVRPADALGPWARGNYAANAGPGWWQMSLNGEAYEETYGKTGPVMGINFGTGIYGIPDGASNTVMFTELRVGVGPKDPRGVWAIGFPGSSVVAANAIADCATPNDRNEDSDDIQGCPNFWYQGIGSRDQIGCGRGVANLGWASWQAQARSHHLAGVNACFADGSVRLISNYVHQATWFYLLSTQDGMAVSY